MKVRISIDGLDYDDWFEISVTDVKEGNLIEIDACHNGVQNIIPQKIMPIEILIAALKYAFDNKTPIELLEELKYLPDVYARKVQIQLEQWENEEILKEEETETWKIRDWELKNNLG